MAKNKDIEAGARIIAEDFKLPGGRRKAVARLVRDNPSWFDAALTRGMDVEDMLDTLTAAGATYKDGSAINYNTFSNALWRKREKAKKQRSRQDAFTSPPGEHGHGRASQISDPGPVRAVDATRTRSGQTGEHGRAPIETAQGHAAAKRSSRVSVRRKHSTEIPRQAKRGKPRSESSSSLKGDAMSNTEKLSYMKRAAMIRRGSRSE